MNDPSIHCSQLCAILDHLSVGVIIVSRAGKVLYINKSAQLITGRKEDDFIDSDCREGPLRELCGTGCFQESGNSGDGSPLRGEFDSGPYSLGEWVEGEVLPAADGKVLPRQHDNPNVSSIVSPLYTSDHRMMGCIVLLHDNSPMKELIDRIRYEDRRLKIILDNLDIVILTVDRGGHVTFFNRMAEMLTGYRREDILGRPYSMLFKKDSYKDAPLLKKTISDGKPRTGEQGDLVTHEGRIVPVRAHFMALKHEDGRIVGGLVTILDLSLMYQLNSAIKERYTFYDIVGKDPAMQKIFDILPVIAAGNTTVLIEGPTGTGKDLLAGVIHHAGKRAGKPMVKVNCAALPENLLESEMFGYVKGAFTGADRDKPGRFQDADGGTLFLDEIGDLPLSLQAKLLRVLEDKEFYPLGSRKTVRVDVRIIAATNQELEKLVSEKRFRKDLFYRLNVIRIELPELRERRGDLPLLISHILERYRISGVTRAARISEDALEVLLSYEYPGNIRELENILEHAVTICSETTIEPKHLPSYLLKYAAQEPVIKAGKKAGRQEEDEKELILATLKKFHWNRGLAADALKMNRSTLWRKMKKYDLF